MSGPRHTFPSDAEKLKTPNLGQVLPPDPEPHNFLSHKDPHYAGGFRIIAECSGFRLLERWRPDGPREVERSDQIEAAWWRALYQGNDAKSSNTPERRTALAFALNRLMHFAGTHREALEPLREHLIISPDDIHNVDGGLGGHVRLGATLGIELLEALNAPDSEVALGELKGRFATALDNLARAHGKKEPDKRRKPDRPGVCDAITHAGHQFACFIYHGGGSLSKSVVRDDMEALGFSFPKKNRKRDWDGLFDRAALGDLPD